MDKQVLVTDIQRFAVNDGARFSNQCISQGMPFNVSVVP